jgi:hypothetical protein
MTGFFLDETVFGQRAEGFAHGTSADIELFAEAFLGKTVPGKVVPAEDALRELRVDGLAKIAFGHVRAPISYFVRKSFDARLAADYDKSRVSPPQGRRDQEAC